MTPLPERDPARRAVVTGLGAIMPIGNDFPTYWANLQAGVSGTRTISSFDPAAQEFLAGIGIGRLLLVAGGRVAGA